MNSPQGGQVGTQPPNAAKERRTRSRTFFGTVSFRFTISS